MLLIFRVVCTLAIDIVTDFDATEGDVLSVEADILGGGNTIEGLAADNTEGNGQHLQLSIKDGGTNVIQTIDLNSVDVTPNADAQQVLNNLLNSDNINDGI